MTTTEPAPTDAPGEIDTDELRRRYLAERDKRLRADGNEQYVEMTGQFAHYLEDPYVEVTPREPLFDEVTVALIGGGFAGLVTGARLKEAGIDDVRIIEKGGDFGGTWYWNRYPGAQCDVESYIYLPLLEETGYLPKEKYTRAPEILAHCRRIAEHYDLYDNACLSTEVTGIEWSAERGRWLIRTNRGDEMAARYLLMGNGPLHRPKLPGIPGVESFAGHSFHTSRWDYDYTGGGPDGGLDRLADKRVAIIGTGATAVQCIPHLAETAQQLYVFQRTPSSIDVRANRPTDPDWAATLEPGWQKERMENFTVLTSGGIAEHDLVMDGWTDIIGKLLTRLRDMDGGTDPMAAMELADFEKMNEIRDRVDELVEDPATAAALKPWYRQFCKRPCFHDEYLQAYNRPNVTLVDTDGKGVARITEHGVVVAGPDGEQEYEIDCLIYGTGFEVGTSYTRRAGYDVVGSRGETLSEHWADGIKTLHGMHVHGFPNMFVISHIQGGFTANYPHLLEEVAKNLTYLLRHALDNDIAEIEVTPDAEAAWVQTIDDTSRDMRRFQESCTPGYYNNEGQPLEGGGSVGASYGGGAMAFFALLDRWREAGDLEGLELRPA